MTSRCKHTDHAKTLFIKFLFDLDIQGYPESLNVVLISHVFIPHVLYSHDSHTIDYIMTC